MNYNHLKDKRLLILGGNPETGQLVQVANSLGITTLVADPYPDSPSKKFATISFDVDVMNINKVVQIAKEEKVDGVLVGVADPLVASYSKICNQLSFPSYVSEGSLIAFTSKDAFVSICEKYNIPTIPRFNFGADFDFPVIVKPVDSGAGVGVTICHDKTEFEQGVAFALKSSVVKRIIIEKYMEAEDIGVYYTFIKGEVFLSAIYDRYKTKKNNSGSPVCIGAVYPSKLLDKFVGTIHPKLVKMFNHLEIQDGVLNIQFFYEKDSFYAYDPGFRLQGEAPHLHLNLANHFDHRKMLINFAITGEMFNGDFQDLNDVTFGGIYAVTTWILLNKGKISEIKGLNKIKSLSSYYDIVQRFKVGDNIEESMLGTERQVFARVYMQNKDKNILLNDVKQVAKLINITDTEQNSLIFDTFTFDGDS